METNDSDFKIWTASVTAPLSRRVRNYERRTKRQTPPRGREHRHTPRRFARHSSRLSSEAFVHPGDVWGPRAHWLVRGFDVQARLPDVFRSLMDAFAFRVGVFGARVDVVDPRDEYVGAPQGARATHSKTLRANQARPGLQRILHHADGPL